jgi:3-hydroxybutyryl-CoA dehydrogenase
MEDIPGFIINRIQTAVIREAFDLYEKGIASAEDIDRAIKGSMGFRSALIGPMLMMDLGGLDAWLDCCERLLPDMHNSTKPPKSLSELVSKGRVGIQGGTGFYKYDIAFKKKKLDDVIIKRDRNFLKLLKKYYWENNSK